MITPPNLDESQQDTAEVRAFFEQWATYRKIVDLDYLHHREAYAAIGRALDDIGRPFSFLDLGAGDADCTSRMLADKPLNRYEAVDLSEAALRLARERTSSFRCPVRLTRGDFFRFVKSHGEPSDVVFIGLSLHHLVAADKRTFLRELRRLVSSGGCLLVYEPICREGEIRDEVMARWWKHAQSAWTGLESGELTRVKEHVFGNDHPETVAAWFAMMNEAGFSQVSVIYTDPQEFYAVIEAHA